MINVTMYNSSRYIEVFLHRTPSRQPLHSSGEVRPLQDHPPQNFEVWTAISCDSSFAIVAFHEFCPRALASTSLTVSEELSQKETELEQCQWLNEMSGNTKIRIWITLSQGHR